MKSRRKERDLLVQAFYAWDVAGRDDALAAVASRVARCFFESPDLHTGALCACAIDYYSSAAGAVDTLVGTQLQSWRLERLGYVERALLRAAVSELSCGLQTPGGVLVHEYVELSRKYAGEDARKLVHAVVDRCVAAHAQGDAAKGEAERL